MPWRVLVDHAPTIVDAARQLYAGSRGPYRRPQASERTTASLETLHRAVEQLEARAVQQAAVLDELAAQVQSLTTALEVLRARVRWALAGAALAVAIAVALATGFFLGR
jgi:methyl-accepting chemotaxis protein